MKKVEPFALSKKQSLILKVLSDEFAGSAFGPQLLTESENEEIKKLTINEITWAMLRLRDNSFVESKKLPYQGRVLNLYTITPWAIYNILDK